MSSGFRLVKSQALGFVIGFSVLTTLTAPGLAASFVLKDGMEFEGQVVQGTHNSIMIQTEGGSLIPLPFNKIATISIVVEGGKVVEGGFLSWSAGAYTLKVDQWIVAVQDGRITTMTESTPPGPVIQESASDVGVGGPSETEPPTPAPPVGDAVSPSQPARPKQPVM